MGRTRFGPFSEHVDGLEWRIGGLSFGGMCVLVLFWKLQVRSWWVLSVWGGVHFLYGCKSFFDMWRSEGLSFWAWWVNHALE